MISTPQIIIFLIATILIFFSIFFTWKGKKGFGLLVWGVILVIIAGVDPISIKKFTSKYLGLERYQPSELEQLYARRYATENLEIIKEKEAKVFIDSVNKRPYLKRSAEDYLVLATVSYRNKKYGEAETLVNAGIRLTPEDTHIKAALFFRRGAILKKKGEISLALRDYKKSIEIDPEFPWPHIGLGIIFSDQANYQQAEFEYMEAIRLDPNISKPHINLGILYKRTLRDSEAETKFKDALKIDPKDADAYLNWGNLYHAKKEFPKAEEKYKKALQFNPKSAAAMNNLGAIYVEWKKYEEGEKLLKEAIKLAPEMPESYKNLGCLYLKRRDYKQSEVQFKFAKKLKPNIKTCSKNDRENKERLATN